MVCAANEETAGIHTAVKRPNRSREKRIHSNDPRAEAAKARLQKKHPHRIEMSPPIRSVIMPQGICPARYPRSAEDWRTPREEGSSCRVSLMDGRRTEKVDRWKFISPMLKDTTAV